MTSTLCLFSFLGSRHKKKILKNFTLTDLSVVIYESPVLIMYDVLIKFNRLSLLDKDTHTNTGKSVISNTLSPSLLSPYMKQHSSTQLTLAKLP